MDQLYLRDNGRQANLGPFLLLEHVVHELALPEAFEILKATSRICQSISVSMHDAH
jgi:hypothetical protein